MHERPPRVLFVGDFAASRLGNYSVAEDLASRIASSGFEVSTTSARPNRWARTLEMLAHAFRVRDGLSVAVIDVYSGRAFAWAEAVCRILRGGGVPYVLVLRGGNLPRFARHNRVRVSRLFESAKRVVALSTYLAESMASHGARPVVIPNPLEIGTYAFRRRRDVKPRLVWLRTFHDIYNPVLVPRVLAHLLDTVPEVRATMVGADKGDGSYACTRREAENLGVAERIEFVGPVHKSAVGAWLQTGDVFLNTARVDNVPISMLEAMACGLCVVATHVGGIPYLVNDGREGLLVPADDAEAMGNAVLRVLRDAELAEALSCGGRRMAERFDWSNVLPAWRQLLHEVAELDEGVR